MCSIPIVQWVLRAMKSDLVGHKVLLSLLVLAKSMKS